MAENITLQEAFDELISGGVTPELPLTSGYQESAIPLAGQSLAAIYEYFKEGITGPIERTMAPLYDKNAQQPTLEDIFMATTMGIGAGWKGGLPAGETGVGITKALHGSPYKGIKKFDINRIGSGEGNQTFGWGFYFSDLKEVVKHYGKEKYDVKLNPNKITDNWMDWYGQVKKDQVQDIISTLNIEGKKDLADRITWISDNLSEGEFLNNNLYDLLGDKLGSTRAASEFLDRAGIDGIRYPTGTMSNTKESGFFNYVIFNPEKIEIIK